MSADDRFLRAAAGLGFEPNAEIRIRGNYTALLRDGDAGRHTRTSVGVHQLPKDASIEIDLVAAIRS